MDEKQKKPKTVELVKSTYQPTKAELAETDKILSDIPEGTPLKQLGKAMLQDVNIRWIDKPRSKK